MEIYKSLNFSPVTVTDRGVRDGIVHSLAYPECITPIAAKLQKKDSEV